MASVLRGSWFCNKTVTTDSHFC